MGGTSKGARKGVETKRKKYGADYHSKVGALGGAKSKGRKIPLEVRKKISETKRKQAKEKSNENN